MDLVRESLAYKRAGVTAENSHNLPAAMKSSASVALACLLLLCARAQPGNRSSKCKCVNSFIGRVNAQLIQAEPVIYEPNIFCTKTEIIVTIANKEKCVNPQSPLGKLILRNKQRQVTKTAARATTASSQTDPWSSARL